MEKQTAVEWLSEQIRNEKSIEDIDFQKAKEMEKQQIIDAHWNGGNEWAEVNIIESEQYYKETFKSE